MGNQKVLCALRVAGFPNLLARMVTAVRGVPCLWPSFLSFRSLPRRNVSAISAIGRAHRHGGEELIMELLENACLDFAARLAG